jgi:hypothetical protein
VKRRRPPASDPDSSPEIQEARQLLEQIFNDGVTRLEGAARDATSSAELYHLKHPEGLSPDEKSFFFSIEILMSATLEVAILLAQRAKEPDTRRRLLDSHKDLLQLVRRMVR